MIYFYPTIAAKDALIAELRQRLADSEEERKALLDRLLTKNRMEPVQEKAAPVAPQISSRVIAPPWVGFEEVQDAQREVWLQEEISYLVNEVGFDEQRARSEAVRRYDEEDLRRLRFIRRAAMAGFTLADIAELIRLDATEDRPRAAAMAAERLAALDVKIAELEASRAALARLSTACGMGEQGPCPILEAFDPD